MKVFKFRPPYQKNGKTTFPERERPGVYIIKEDNKIVYVGFSSNNLYRTMYRHFQRWHHRFQPVVTYSNRIKEKAYTVRVIYCTPKQADKLEKMLIKKYQPRDNDLSYIDYEPTNYDTNLVDDYFNTDVSSEIPF